MQRRPSYSFLMQAGVDGAALDRLGREAGDGRAASPDAPSAPSAGSYSAASHSAGPHSAPHRRSSWRRSWWRRLRRLAGRR